MQLIVLGVVLFLLIASSSGMDGNIYKPGKDLFFIGSFLAQYLFFNNLDYREYDRIWWHLSEPYPGLAQGGTKQILFGGVEGFILAFLRPIYETENFSGRGAQTW